MNSFILLLQAPAAPESGMGTWGNLVFFGAMLAVLYFFMILPQRRAQRKQEDFKSTLKKGQKVVTIGGIHGIITNVSDRTVSLMIAPKIIIEVQRECISSDYSLAANSTQDGATTESNTKEQSAAETTSVQPDNKK